MSNQKEKFIICLVCFLTGFLGGVILSEVMTVKRMQLQFLEGYRAFAIYETNSVGEVKIKRIEWKKP